MKINLLYLAEPKFGGWVSFTEHLYLCLKKSGHDVSLFGVSQKFNTEVSLFSGSVGIQKIPIQSIFELNGFMLVTALDKSNVQNAEILLKRKVGYVVHDPTELTEDRINFYRKSHKVFGIRKNMIPVLSDNGINASYLPHPYCSVNPKRKVSFNAVAYSRLDWDKHTDIIAEANSILPRDKRCRIYGAENSMYTFHKLSKRFPDWKNNYFGKFPKATGAGAMLASNANWAVDMSVIKNDGSGSQYTFLEAWDAGSGLVLNNKWTKDNTGEMKSGVNCISIENGSSLAAILLTEPPKSIIENGKASLLHHEHNSVNEAFVGGLV